MTNTPDPGPDRAGGPVAGIVLAAGCSSRMPGASKLLRPLGDATVIECVAESAREASLDPLVAVVGPTADPVAERLASRGARVVTNPDAARGRTTSLRAGLRALEPPPAAVVVLLGDEPNVDPEVIRALIARWRKGSGTLLRVRYRDRPGHPVLLDRSVFEAAEALPDGEVVWDALAPAVKAREVAIATVAPVDVDRPEDLRRARERRRE